MKKSIALLLVLVSIIALLAGCGGEIDAFKGIWSGSDDNGFDVTIIFDGKGGLRFTGNGYNREKGNYTISGNDLEMNVSFWSAARNYTFAIDGNELTLTRPDAKFYVNFDLIRE